MITSHEEMVRTLKKCPESISNKLNALRVDAIHMVFGISGEAGELLDAIKKWVIYDQEINRENVIEELGDIEFYLEGLRQCLSITREDTLNANIAKLSKRYKNFQYTDLQAKEREDKK